MTRVHQGIFVLGLVVITAAASLFPAVSFAISITPTSYNPPATVTYTGNTGGDGCALYIESSPSAPMAYEQSSGCPTTDDLNTLAWTAGSFDGNTLGDYDLIAMVAAACGGASNKTLADCKTANDTVGNPSRLAIFEIVEAPAPDVPIGGATSTIEQAQSNLAWGFWFFFLSFFGVIWLLRKH